MADLKTISDLVIPVDITYMGDISYRSDAYTVASGESIVLKPTFNEPLAFSIAKDVFSVVTKTQKYADVFNDLRKQKEGIVLDIAAIAQNEYSGYESLSAVQVEDGVDSIIAMYDTALSGDDTSDIVKYSFNSTVRYLNSTMYWSLTGNSLSSIDRPDTLTDDHYFYFKFLDGTYCNILKETSAGTKYLTYDIGDGSFDFNLTEDETYSRFIYSYNSEDNTIVLIIPGVGILGYTDAGTLSSVPFTSEVSDVSNVFELDIKNSLDSSEPVTNCFVPRYENKNNITAKHEVDNISLVTHNYASNITTNSNYIPLKSNLVYDENQSLVTTNQDTFFRKYSAVNSGIRGDSGYNNYILSYNCDWYKFEFASDQQTYFNIPFELRGYSQINIQDCKLISNGAIGGNSPLNSDKIYKKLYEYSNFKNTGSTANVDNSKYLCSWLWFNPLNPSQSKWLDRYYNPDKVTQLGALSEEGWTLISGLSSFSTTHPYIGAYADYFSEFDKQTGIFDVESKLTIQKDALYMYERQGVATSTLLLKDKDDVRLAVSSDEVMDYENEFSLLTDTMGDDEEFTVNVTLDNFDLSKVKGNKIFGNRSLSLIIDKDFSPYALTVDNDTLHYYDYDYNYIKSLALSSTIDDVIFTDDYNKFFVDCGGVIYTVETLDFVTNETTTLTSFSNISDIAYYNQKLYTIDSVSGEVSSYAYDSDELTYETLATAGDNVLVNVDGTINTGIGDYIDHDASGNIYTLSSNEIRFNDISTPIISSSDILDFYVASDDVIYVLKPDALFKIDNEFVTTTIKSIDITPTYALSSFDVIRYQRDGEIYEYIDVVDTLSSDTNILRYDSDLNLVDTLSRTISGDFIFPKARSNTKFLEKELQFKVTLYDIFNYYKRGDVELTIDSKYIEENSTNVINIIFSNAYGTITTYCNGALIDIFKFDSNKYHFSNTLRDNKIFVGGSYSDDESTVNDIVLSSDNDMVSGGYTIKDLSIYNTHFNYFDVINYNRVHLGVPSCSLVIPIKTRSYVEEISGFYTQNKNLRKSEFGSITIRGTDLTDAMQTDIKSKIDTLYEDTFINLQINETTFK